MPLIHNTRSKAPEDCLRGRLRVRPFRKARPPAAATSHLGSKGPNSLFAVNTAPDLNVPMDIFDEDPDEEPDQASTDLPDDDNPLVVVGADARAAFSDVTDKQVVSCWHARRRHRAQLSSGHGVHYPGITNSLWSTQQNVRFQGLERLNRHRLKKALIAHNYVAATAAPPGATFIAGRMGHNTAKVKRNKLLDRDLLVQNSCCLNTIL